VRLRLERNTAPTLGANSNWTLPPLTVVEAKTTRGFIGVTSDASLRLTSGTFGGLAEAGPSTFPRKIDSLQAAWRIQESTWNAAVRVEKLAASVQSDALHIFSVGEGLAYGAPC